ncbi:hypothetical protein Sama_3324 [Shewanella amazonensis SB2B]|uniref:Uncharacterized protein n=1 Tax=Shewanella amazonensis (strain ATCC BAA-1098 / SB2B) TaxID=326297 RepID=A1SAX0_SHEAM|nr:hypothetical protein Sama_3324 [Shewanella amazonensis SB2B]
MHHWGKCRRGDYSAAELALLGLALLPTLELAFVAVQALESIPLGLTLFERMVVAGNLTELPGGIRGLSPECQRPLIRLSTGAKQEDNKGHKCDA